MVAFFVVAHGIQSIGSIVVAHACASLLRGMWDLPGSGIKPTCLALTAGFFTTEPPGKRLAVKSFHLTIFQIINRSKPTVEIRVQIKNFCS